jgi:excisionase family DNA binding protein
MANYLGVSESSATRLVAAGKIPAPVRLGSCRAWDRVELDRWLDRRTPGGDLPTAAEWRTIYPALLTAARN